MQAGVGGGYSETVNDCCRDDLSCSSSFLSRRRCFSFLAPCCLLSVSLTLSFCLHSFCIHQILDSVSYAHQHEIVHRDLKVCVCAALVLAPRLAPVPISILFVPVFQTCLCLLSVRLCVSLSLSVPLFCASARLQALHLGLFLGCFGCSEAYS